MEGHVVFAAGCRSLLVDTQSAQSDRGGALFRAAMDLLAGICDHLDAAPHQFLLFRTAVPGRDTSYRHQLSGADLRDFVRGARAARRSEVDPSSRSRNRAIGDGAGAIAGEAIGDCRRLEQPKVTLRAGNVFADLRA